MQHTVSEQEMIGGEKLPDQIDACQRRVRKKKLKASGQEEEEEDWEMFGEKINTATLDCNSENRIFKQNRWKRFLAMFTKDKSGFREIRWRRNRLQIVATPHLVLFLLLPFDWRQFGDRNRLKANFEFIELSNESTTSSTTTKFYTKDLKNTKLSTTNLSRLCRPLVSKWVAFLQCNNILSHLDCHWLD